MVEEVLWSFVIKWKIIRLFIRPDFVNYKL